MSYARPTIAGIADENRAIHITQTLG
jgi:hypothetical protein